MLIDFAIPIVWYGNWYGNRTKTNPNYRDEDLFYPYYVDVKLHYRDEDSNLAANRTYHVIVNLTKFKSVQYHEFRTLTTFPTKNSRCKQICH